VAAGGTALGTAQGIRHAEIASFEGVVPKETDWRNLAIAKVAAAE